jgi:DNA modification methylase
MAKVYFYNEDCLQNMKRMAEKNFKIDLVLTSPPYATSRSTVKTEKAIETYNRRYDICLDNMNDEEYCNWTVDIFNHLDKVLSKNGVVLYNISYGSENPSVMWLAMSDIIKRTNFMIADCIIWKKKSALPNNVGNKLTRITEFVFVICRKNEFKTFNINKKIKSVREDTGQKYYENTYNFIEAKNNDGTCKLNKATYSSDLCLQLLDIYATPNTIVFDPFMGSGTTGVACEKFCQEDTMMCIGCELSADQIAFSKERLAKVREDIANGKDKDVKERNKIIEKDMSNEKV